MKKIVMLAGVLLMVCSQVVCASDSVWIPNAVNINAIRAYAANDAAHFVFVDDASYWEGCTNTQSTGGYYLPPESDDAYNMLLAAKLADRSVHLSVKGYDECHDGYAVITEVQLGEE